MLIVPVLILSVSDTNWPGRIPNDMKSQRLKAMLIDTCIHGSLVSHDDIGDQVDILIVYIDPTDNQFFWAVINEEPYVSWCHVDFYL
jgi:hypothetical protein